MNSSEEITRKSDLKRIGTYTCIFTILAIFIAVAVLLTKDWMAGAYASPPISELIKKLSFGIPLFSLFQIPIPGLALILFRTTGKIGQMHAAALIFPYIILSIYFWMHALGEASKDAQGGLVFLFGPIYISLICTAILVIFSPIYYICRKIKKRSDQN